MNHYLIVFDRSEGRLLRFERCTSSADAMKARFEAERLHRRNPDIEIVVLGARSRDAVRLTHARYFDAVGDLAQRGVGLVYEQRSAAAEA
jgi:hypothetical protein